MLRKVGINLPDSQVKWIIKIADKDKDGKLDAVELKNLIDKALKYGAKAANCQSTPFSENNLTVKKYVRTRQNSDCMCLVAATRTTVLKSMPVRYTLREQSQ